VLSSQLSFDSHPARKLCNRRRRSIVCWANFGHPQFCLRLLGAFNLAATNSTLNTIGSIYANECRIHIPATKEWRNLPLAGCDIAQLQHVRIRPVKCSFTSCTARAGHPTFFFSLSCGGNWLDGTLITGADAGGDAILDAEFKVLGGGPSGLS